MPPNPQTALFPCKAEAALQAANLPELVPGTSRAEPPALVPATSRCAPQQQPHHLVSASTKHRACKPEVTQPLTTDKGDAKPFIKQPPSRPCCSPSSQFSGDTSQTERLVTPSQPSSNSNINVHHQLSSASSRAPATVGRRAVPTYSFLPANHRAPSQLPDNNSAIAQRLTFTTCSASSAVATPRAGSAMSSFNPKPITRRRHFDTPARNSASSVQRQPPSATTSNSAHITRLSAPALPSSKSTPTTRRRHFDTPARNSASSVQRRHPFTPTSNPVHITRRRAPNLFSSNSASAIRRPNRIQAHRNKSSYRRPPRLKSTRSRMNARQQPIIMPSHPKSASSSQIVENQLPIRPQQPTMLDFSSVLDAPLQKKYAVVTEQLP
eukprot:TRINITY_DN2090_c0_g1_i1.p1 TRINITY_DN2090_c0_g1~~TRINITY_DN2090_c0_g1_i1.p1  ORF type:complete len:381 (+),score=38.93 TRINITY_DN2090_c0_g1_i1:211-1353(+)